MIHKLTIASFILLVSSFILTMKQPLQGNPQIRPVVSTDSSALNKAKTQASTSGPKKPGSSANDKGSSAHPDNSQSKAFTNYLKQINEAEIQEENLYITNEDLKKDIKKNEQSINQLDVQKSNLKEKIASVVHQKNGSDTLTFKGAPYYVFIADVDTYDIKLHWKDSKGKIYGNIGTLLHSSTFRDNAPVMITNGGMFNPDISPEGLLVENGTAKASLNTTRPNSENFYLKPNGIFYISKDGIAHIDTTSEAFNAQLPNLDQATQSGPKLVINGKIHDKFARASSNKKIRSGVGLISSKKVVFIISQTEVNFYDFALLFKDVYNCSNALFLDGAISMMYLRDLAPNEIGGHFCTLISATRKKRTK